MGRGDCEGWLYKRKEKDRKLAKNWTKRWCVLKNANMYYYKSKEVGTPGVLLLHHQADWWVHPAAFCCTTRQTGGPQ